MEFPGTNPGWRIRMEKLPLILVFCLAFAVLLGGCTLEAECGDSVCNRLMESEITCPKDCTQEPAPEPQQPYCGNSMADEGENCGNCAQDVICGAGDKCLEGKCVSTEACNAVADCPANKKCVKGYCALMACKERNGYICDGNKNCEGRLLNVSGSVNCCSEECILKSCGEHAGKICDGNDSCSASFIRVSDSNRCCPAGERCMAGATCSRDFLCKTGCSGGDADCVCMEQGGLIYHDANACLPANHVRASDAPCCLKDLLTDFVCEDSDNGTDYYAAGTCKDYQKTYADKTYDTKKNVNSRQFSDVCYVEGGTTYIREYYCALGFFGPQFSSCVSAETPASQIENCDRCLNGACLGPVGCYEACGYSITHNEGRYWVCASAGCPSGSTPNSAGDKWCEYNRNGGLCCCFHPE